ncbi:hypothetical protein Bca4012_044076 [Brassica carinata]
MSSSQSDKKRLATARAHRTLLLLMWHRLALPVSFLLGINWLAVMPKKVAAVLNPFSRLLPHRWMSRHKLSRHRFRAILLLLWERVCRSSGSSTKPGPVAEKEQTVETMPPPPVKREIVLALRAPSTTFAAPPKRRKRSCTTSKTTKKKRCIKSEEGETSLRGGTGLMSQHRAKFVSLIDGLIGNCGSEVGRLSKELENSQEASSQLEDKLKIVEESYASETSQLEIRISDLERDFGKC